MLSADGSMVIHFFSHGLCPLFSGLKFRLLTGDGLYVIE